VRGKHAAAARALGVEGVVVLDDGGGDIARLPALDGIANTIFGDTIQALLGNLVPGGKIGSVVGEPAGAAARGFVVRAFLTHNDPGRLGELAQAVADGKLVVPIAKRFPLAEARAAHEVAEAGADGKVLLLG
jgi:NADPH:quinone reductase-like Zn-dependent oxidoreductase